MTTPGFHVTRHTDEQQCRFTHPFTREQCRVATWGHHLHHTHRSGSFWRTDTGRTTSPVGEVYVTYFGRFIPYPGHPAEDVVEHFPNQLILHSQLVQRTRHGHGTSFEPGGLQRPVRYTHPSGHAYMDVWIMATADPSVIDPVPAKDAPAMERWTLTPADDCHRTEYLPVVVP